MVQLLQLKGAGIGAPRTIIFLKWLLYSLHWIYNLHLRVLGILYISVVAGFPFHISCVFTVCELCVFLLHTITCVFTMCMSLCVSSSDLTCSTHCVFLLQLCVPQVHVTGSAAPHYLTPLVTSFRLRISIVFNLSSIFSNSRWIQCIHSIARMPHSCPSIEGQL